MVSPQRTLQQSVELEGVGLFTGQRAHVRLRQAAPETGIVFNRLDLPGKPRIEVGPDSVHEGFRNVVLKSDQGEVQTVEHVLSALYGMGLDNVEIDLTGPELPVGDGSSRVYVDLLQKAGAVDQSEPKKEFVIKEPVSVVDGAASLIALPSDEGLSISCTIDYSNQIIGKQHYSLNLTDRSYVEEIAPARTFCLRSEAEEILRKGLGTGATPQNTIVVDESNIVETQLRYRDEFVRHKILDLIGDLATLGTTLRGHVVAIKTGHRENIKLIRKLAEAETRVGEPARRSPDTLLDIRELCKILPHRYPFLLIDRVIEMDGYRRAVGIKNVTINEPFFTGHFPGQPIMPGVLIIEAMAQLAGALLMRKSENSKRLPVLLSMDGVKLRKSVTPGDQLRIETETLRLKSRTGEVYAKAMVEGQIAAEATMKFMIIEHENL
jgi:UDP-3-O-[3-hydroxymyristoyl] N-acetylglucosamine deacetylase/3-hydroxyacyl-[acyl-carrier-protein] dehydratase